MNSHRLSIPPDAWPEFDRQLWRAALKPAGFLEAATPASEWSPARRRIIEQSYGQWLAWLAYIGKLDMAAHPAARITPQRTNAFVAHLSDRISSVSVAMMVAAIARLLAVLAPERDWAWLTKISRALKRAAKPSRNKSEHAVLPEILFSLGVEMMQVADTIHPHPRRQATHYRDGLFIATLIACPMRMRNLAMVQVGVHLRNLGDDYTLDFAAEETKTQVADHFAVPPDLTPCIQRYLDVHRSTLIEYADPQSPPHSYLWIDRFGQPATPHTIRDQIKAHTKRAFGKEVWPHLFRDCAATGLVHHAPEEISMAADLLGHATLQTTQKHYILAQSEKAHKVFGAWLNDRRQLANRSSTH